MQNISEQVLSIIAAAEKLVIQIRQSYNQSNSYDISAVRATESGKKETEACAFPSIRSSAQPMRPALLIKIRHRD